MSMEMATVSVKFAAVFLMAHKGLLGCVKIRMSIKMSLKKKNLQNHYFVPAVRMTKCFDLLDASAKARPHIKHL